MVKLHVLLTGSPGIGKTTLVKRIIDILRRDCVNIFGFYTEEVRQKNVRIGFDVLTLDGKRSPLARSSGFDSSGQSAKPRVGKYIVDIDSFESVCLPTINVKAESRGVVIVDEIGKMESFSAAFCESVLNVFALQHCVVLATIPIAKSVPIVAKVSSRGDTKVYKVTQENRDHLVEEIVARLKSSLETQ